jgi:hypothetical protein
MKRDKYMPYTINENLIEKLKQDRRHTETHQEYQRLENQRLGKPGTDNSATYDPIYYALDYEIDDVRNACFIELKIEQQITASAKEAISSGSVDKNIIEN